MRGPVRKGQPTQSDVHYDALLTNLSTAYIQNQTNFIATKVFPIVNVSKQANRYPTYTKNDWFQDDAQLRGDSEESAGSGFTLSNDPYFCDVWGYHKDIGDQLRANADGVYNVDRDATEFVAMKMLLRQELQWVSEFFKSGIWGTSLVGGAGFIQFSDYAGSTPIDVVTTGTETVLKNTGFEPNTLVLGLEVYNKLKNHPDFVDRVKYSAPDAVTTAIMANLFEVDNVYVAKAVKATNAKGAAGTYDFVFGKNALLCYTPKNPGLLTPAAGYIFSWDYAPVGGSMPISRLRIDTKKTDRVEAEAAWDNKLIGSDLGYFLSGAVA